MACRMWDILKQIKRARILEACKGASMNLGWVTSKYYRGVDKSLA